MQRFRQTIDEIAPAGSVFQVDPNTPVLATLELMRDKHVGCILVTNDGLLVGIFTERDHLNRVVAPGLSLTETPVGEVMTASPTWLRGRDLLAYAINEMVVGGYRHIPILDAEGCPSSVLSARDVLQHLEEIFGNQPEEGDPEDGDPFDDWVDIGGG